MGTTEEDASTMVSAPRVTDGTRYANDTVTGNCRSDVLRTEESALMPSQIQSFRLDCERIVYSLANETTMRARTPQRLCMISHEDVGVPRGDVGIPSTDGFPVLARVKSTSTSSSPVNPSKQQAQNLVPYMLIEF